MWELNHGEGRASKNWGFLIVVMEKTLESHLDSKEIKPVNPKGNELWIFIGRTDAETETPILWPPHEKSQLIGKDPDAGKDWGQKKGATEDEMVGWHHWLNGHESEQAPGAGAGQGSLACCSPWGHKELDTTERLNWTDNVWHVCIYIVLILYWGFPDGASGKESTCQCSKHKRWTWQRDWTELSLSLLHSPDSEVYSSNKSCCNLLFLYLQLT